MIVTVNPSKVQGCIKSPVSKSSMQRACAAALLSDGRTTLVNPGKSNDDLAAIEVIRQLGATIAKAGDELLIDSSGVHAVSNTIHCGESGLGIRMFTPIASLSNDQITITGQGSLLQRPMNFFDEVLPGIGVAIKSNSGKLPIIIKGPLKPKNIDIDGSLSSQFLTGLLMAYAGAEAKDVTIHVQNLNSKPYIDLTLQVMKAFGVEVLNNDFKSFYFPGSTSFIPTRYVVEGDWSGSAFLLVAATIAGEIEIQGLDITSTQADKKIMEALRDSGAVIKAGQNTIHISASSCAAFEFDATDCPDLFPPLVSLAAHCKGNTEIRGVHRLKHKESDRAITLQEEFAKMGIEIELQNDSMIIHGADVKSATVHSHHDHRIAMACATAALKSRGPVTIKDAEAINKSYPDFYSDLQMLGASLSL